MREELERLGLNPQSLRRATHEEILALVTANYRSLCRVFHPDMPGGDRVRFREISEAYEILITTEQLDRAVRQTLGKIRVGLDHAGQLARECEALDDSIEELRSAIVIALKLHSRRSFDQWRLYVGERRFPNKYLLVEVARRHFRLNFGRAHTLASLQQLTVQRVNAYQQPVPTDCTPELVRLKKVKKTLYFECLRGGEADEALLADVEILGTSILKPKHEVRAEAKAKLEHFAYCLLVEKQKQGLSMAEFLEFADAPSPEWRAGTMLVGYDRRERCVLPMGILFENFS